METTVRKFSSLKSVLWAISSITGIATFCLGLVVVIGWHAGNRTLVQVMPQFAPMQYNTALGFILCGSSLLLLIFHRSRWAAVAGYLAALIGCLTLVEYTAHVDLGIDEFLMDHGITVATSHSGRMAPNTALCFTFVGLAVLSAETLWTFLREFSPLPPS